MQGNVVATVVNCDCTDSGPINPVPTSLSVSRCNTAGCSTAVLSQAGPPDPSGFCTITYTVSLPRAGFWLTKRPHVRMHGFRCRTVSHQRDSD